MNYFVSYRLLIPTVKTIRFVLCLSLLLSCSPLLHAQVEEADSLATVVEAPPVEYNDDYGEKIGTLSEQSPPEFRQVPDSTIRDLKSRKEFAYANDPSFWKEPEVEMSATNRKGFWDYFYDLFSSKYTKIFAYGILIAFFLFIMYRIVVVNKLFLFYSSKKAKTEEADGDADITDSNLDDKIKQAIAAGEHRMAVRYMYLKALSQLNEKNWIRYHADGTNYEYVSQMSGRKLASEFSSLTRVYDYMWYGEFTVTDEQFDIIHKNFSHFYNAVNS
jgi:hypothetical protein